MRKKSGDFMPKITGVLKVKTGNDQEEINIKGVKKNNLWTLYDDNAVKYRFELDNKMLKYDKMSQETLSFLFDVYRDTEAWYEIDSRRIDFTVKTNDIIIDNNDIRVSYQLYQGDILLNRIEFSLQCELMKEEHDG